MPKVLFITDSLSNGGAERQLTLLVRSLSDKWECRVWSMDTGPFAHVIRGSGVSLQVRERLWRWDLTPALDLWSLVRTWQPDIVHSYGYMSTLAALPIVKLLGIPLVDGTIRQANVPSYRGRIMIWSLKWANRVIANSKAGLNAFGIDPERGRVVHNGFDLARVEKYPQKQSPSPIPTVIMVGRMVPEKDYATFIKAARQLIENHGQWRFIAMGAGILREAFMEQARDLIEKKCFEFPEPTLEVLPYVTKADIGVLMTSPGIHEGISNAITEYMASSLPVICTESGGNCELVVDGKTGFIIEPGNVAELTGKLLWLKNHPQDAHNMGKAGKERIKHEFSIERLVANTLSVYSELLA